MSHPLRNTRRSFLKHLGAAATAAPFITRNLIAAPPSNRIRHASFGAAGMGGGDMMEFARHPNVDVVCVADVDSAHLANVKKRLPDAKIHLYQDWRELLDKEHKNLDTVNVGTPDHMHAPIAMSAMQLGLHAYVQKPLAHDIYEVRRLAETARDKKLVSQMGIQIHSSPYYRIAVKLIQSGAIGKVKEVHSWSSKKWGDTSPLPERSDPVPASLNWDLWLGVCSPRPFLAGYYHPGNWRKRLDFGTGTFGDMGCHIFDPVFAALALTAPLSLVSDGPAPNRWNWAMESEIHYVYPATPYTEGPTVPVHWYDGDRRPPKDVQSPLGQRKLPDQGSLFLGTKGAMLLPHVDRPLLLPEKEFKDFPLPKDSGTNHNWQFIDAVLGKTQASAAFDYSGPLTESVLLGGVATRFPKVKLLWDAAGLKFSNSADATAILRRDYRKGWEVKGLS